MHVGPTLQHDCFNVSCLLRNNVVINEELMSNFAGEILNAKYLYLFQWLVEYIKISQKAVAAFLPIDAKNGGHFGLHNVLSMIYLNSIIIYLNIFILR